MKKLIPVIMIIILLSSCSSSTADSSFTDSQENLISSSGDENMCESARSYYYLKNNFIYVIDKESRKASVLCDKPNCLHESEAVNSKCQGYINSTGTENLRWYNGGLYATANEERRDSDGNLHYFSQIIKISPDGSSRMTIYESDEMEIYTLKTHRGYFYFTACEYGNNITGDVETSSIKTHLYRLPIEGGKAERIRIKYFEKRRDVSNLKSEGYDVQRMYFFGDYIYLRYSGNVGGKLSDGIARVKLDTLEDEDIGKKLGLDRNDFTVLNNKLYYISGETLYEAKADGTDKKVVKNLDPYGYKGGYSVNSSDGKNVVISCYESDDPNKNEGGHILLFNPKTKAAVSIETPCPTHIGGTKDCLLVFDDTGELYYVDKATGKSRKIYEFRED